MSEEVISSINRIQEALKRIPREDAETIAADAAIRAEAVADYVERTAKQETLPA